MHGHLRRSFRIEALVALATVLACSDEPSPEGLASEPERLIERGNRGRVCLSPAPDGAIEVRVVFDQCLSSCRRPDAASCSVVLDGGQLSVTSQLSYRVGNPPVCNSDCAQARAACGVITPTTSSLQVLHGEDASEPIALPLAGTKPVFDDREFCERHDIEYDFGN